MERLKDFSFIINNEEVAEVESESESENDKPSR